MRSGSRRSKLWKNILKKSFVFVFYYCKIVGGKEGSDMEMWKKKNLPKSDAQQPTEGSNPTCNLRLSQAGYAVDGDKIDQTSYFRDDVFAECDWTPTENGEKTEIEVELKIDGESKGNYHLKVTHEPHRESNQDNVTTILHWEEAIPALTEKDITGMDLTLSREDNGTFGISID